MYSPVYIDLYSKSRCGKVEAFQELVRMSDEGDKLAKCYYAVILKRSTILTVPKNISKAVSLFKEVMPWLLEMESSDEYNSAHIWYILAVILLEDLGIGEYDKARAIQYYKMSFDKGHALAQCDLANCYDIGDSVEQNIFKARSYYELSAEQGFAVAQNNACLCYELGEGCKQDQGKALRFAEMAAEQGNSGALYNLVIYYIYGKGVEIDPLRALKYCQESAAQGDLDSLYVLGDSYIRGYGQEIDCIKGFQLLLSAANRHHDLSQIYVAECYHIGQGVAVNIIEAVRYLRRAVKIKNSTTTIAEDLMSEYAEEYKAQVKNCVMI
jgi:TPR repeat protein